MHVTNYPLFSFDKMGKEMIILFFYHAQNGYRIKI
jgi:hypothetical protein